MPGTETSSVSPTPAPAAPIPPLAFGKSCWARGQRLGTQGWAARAQDKFSSNRSKKLVGVSCLDFAMSWPEPGPCLRPLSASAHRPSRGALHKQGKWFVSPRWVSTLQRSCRWPERVRSDQVRSRSSLAAGIPTHVAGAAAGGSPSLALAEKLRRRRRRERNRAAARSRRGKPGGRGLFLPCLSFQRIANCWERTGSGAEGRGWRRN